MMVRWTVLAGVVLLAAAAWAQDDTAGVADSSLATSAPATIPSYAASQPSQADQLAADSLRHSAMSMIHARWGTRGRAGRLVALAAFAHKLAPADLRTAWVLSGIYDSRRDSSAAEDMMLVRLRADPSDFTLGMDYVRVGLAARARPDDRQAFLKTIMDNPTWPDALRAQAAVEQGQALMSERNTFEALQLFNRALELDPLNGEALQGSLMARQTPLAPEDSIGAMSAMLQGSPRATGLLRNLASTLAVLGLHKEAAPLFDAIWADAVASAEGGYPPLDVAGQYLNSLLDSGRAQRAVEIFQPIMDHYSQDRAMAFMEVEAYRSAGQDAQAEQAVQRIVHAIQPATGGHLSVSDAAELAWTYTIYLPRPDQALTYARQAAAADPNSPVLQRLLGAAELLSGEKDLVESGRARLEKIRAQDPAAPALLAEYYAAAGNEASASAAIADAVASGYSGWAYRRVRDLAAARHLTVPPHAGAEAARQIFQQFDPRILDMGNRPEKYLSVTLRGPSDPWRVGEGLEIEAVLTNTGELPVPLGPVGLIRPTMSLEAAAPGPTQERFRDLPMIDWPAPKYLPPGQSVRTTVRLDVGALEYFLARHPLEDVELTVTAMLDPVQRGRETVSSAPSIVVAPLTVTRRGLLGDLKRDDPNAWAEAYRYALRVIMTDLVRGDLPRRMRAARQLGELMTLVRDVQLFKARLPDELKGAVNKNVLLAMIQKVMQDPSDVVRAEMLAALDQAFLDDSIIQIVVPAANDASPLVRFRLVELLSSAGQGRGAETVDALTRDNDPLVRQMVAAFGPSTGQP
jgi:tetratricopeptide (TPR) repeat protein